jgi:hypothetical protein
MRTTETPPEVGALRTEHQPLPTSFFGRPAEEGEVVYHTEHAGLIVQITSPADRFDPSTGSVLRARPVKAVFEPVGDTKMGEYRTRDADIIRELEGNPRYGLGKSYWRADQFASRARAAMKDSIKSQLQGDPALVAEVLQELNGSEFELPAAK